MMNKKKAIKSITMLWMGSLLGAVCAFLTQLILARSLGPEEFGVFSSIFAIVSLIVPVAGFGVAQYWLKEFGKDGWKAVEVITPSIRFLSISTLLMLSLIIMWAFWGPHDKKLKISLVIMSVYIFGQVSVELMSAKFQLEEQYRRLALLQFLPHLIRLLSIFIFSSWLGGDFDVKMVTCLFSFGSVLLMFLAVKQIKNIGKGSFALKGHGHNEKIFWKFKRISIRSVFINAWPFGMAGFFHLIYFQSDIVLVKYISGNEAAGYYNVAFNIMVAVLLLPGIIYQKFLLPKMHRWANHNRPLFYKIYQQGNIIMLLLGVVAMITILAIFPIALPALFGNEYQEAVALLNILAMSAPILFVASNVGAVLVTKEHMRMKVRFMGYIAIVNVILNLVMIPPYGAMGAAIATVISNFLLLFIYYYAVSKVVFKEASNEFAR